MKLTIKNALNHESAMNLQGLIVGLGNPGPKYAGTRHNLGFAVIEALLDKLESNGDRVEPLSGSRFRSLLWKVLLPNGRDPWLVATPQTFMNLSGEAVQPLMDWYRLSLTRLLVIHDELDLEPGRLKLKSGGGLAGHNGLKSIAERLGTRDFHRLRLGVGKAPAGRETISWVLGHFSPQEVPLIKEMIPEAVEAVFRFADQGPERAANTVNIRSKSGNIRSPNP